MKKFEVLINKFEFGIFFPIWYCDCLINRCIEKIYYSTIFKRLSNKRQKEVKEELENADGFIHDLQLLYNYKLLDFICGCSPAILFVEVTIPFANLFSFVRPLDPIIILFIIGFGSAYIIIDYFFYKDNKRINYFAEFEKEPINTIWKWSVVSWSLLIIAWILAFRIRHWLDNNIFL